MISTDPFILATIRPNNIQALEKDANRTGDIEELAAPPADLRTVIEEVVKKRRTAWIYQKRKLS